MLNPNRVHWNHAACFTLQWRVTQVSWKQYPDYRGSITMCCYPSMLHWECPRPACPVDFDEFRNSAVPGVCLHVDNREGWAEWHQLNANLSRISIGHCICSCMCCVISVQKYMSLIFFFFRARVSKVIAPIILSLKAVSYVIGSVGMQALAHAK